MKRAKSKLALFQSVVSLLLCISMLVGTTFAWFSASETSTGNIIQTGSLKVGMEWANTLEPSIEEADWKDAEQGAIFNYEHWEPGYTDLKYLKIINKGNLAFQYQLNVLPAEQTTEAGESTDSGNSEESNDPAEEIAIAADVAKLADVIDVYYGRIENGFATREEAMSGLQRVGTLSALMGKGTAQGILLPEEGTGSTRFELPAGALADKGEAIACIMLKMREDAGNEYMGLSAGDGFRVQLQAVQYTYEKDDFGSDYDTAAMLPTLIHSISGSAEVNVADGKTTAEVTIGDDFGGATIPAGVAVADGTTALTLSIAPKTDSEANVTLGATEAAQSLDVHIDGVAEGNTVPMIVNLGVVLPPYMNQGNVALYHVENGATNPMTQVATLADLDAHNEFYYDVNTGNVTVAMASFSEIAVVADTTNAWNGKFDYTWYDAFKTELTIANADQLAGFGAIVGGMNGQTPDDFAEKTVKLISDIDLGDKNNANESIIFHPIGYCYKDGDSTVKSFEGEFDGTGHTISNFYQNTWEIKGDYDGTYYKDAMGLFGYVANGTVKNLTVDNFSSDGEYTPTGVIAAYADGNSIFENIAITNCNPRVYNTGNGGIIGIAGDTSAANDDHITLKNITVDNSNKISALWGSYDVACGGLVGMYRGNVDGSGNATGDTISFENCHVSAIMDVYNDVCGNYQYYAYRYAGMIIGSIRHNTQNAEGKTIPNMTGISASGCTVNYGDWNDYYYCEFEKNTMASYSEDYQFSRVPHSELKFTDSNGNGVVDANERASVTGCKHNHTAEENHQAVYLPFHQLFTGYSWGVSSIGIEELEGIKTDFKTNIEVGPGQEKSVLKFASAFPNSSVNEETGVVQTPFLYRVGTQNEVTAGTLFKELRNDVVDSGVYVSVTSQHDDGINMGTFTPNTSDWTQGKIKFDKTGIVKVTIQDYDFCTPTVLYLEVIDAKNVSQISDLKDYTNYVLLNKIRIGNGGVVYLNSSTLYGNGFEFNVVGGVNTATNGNNYHGIINLTNATIDNVRVVGEVYDKYGAYKDNEDYTAAINATDSVIQNCYIANCSAPVRSKGNNSITKTTLYGGTIGNIIIEAGTNTLTDVTTVNYNDDRNIIGLGIIVSDSAAENTKIILEGYLKQHNYVCKDDIKKVPGAEAQAVFNSMFGDTFKNYRNADGYLNTGIIFMTKDLNTDIITDNANTGYTPKDDANITLTVAGMSATVNGAVYSSAGRAVDNNYDATKDEANQGNYLPTPNFDLGDQAVTGEDRYLKGDIKGVEARYVEGETPFTLDITKLMKVYKYSAKDNKPHYYEVAASCKDAKGNTLSITDGSITLKDAGAYTLEFTIVDDQIFGADGNKLAPKPYTYTVPLTLSVAEPAIKDAVITVNKTALDGGYNESYGDRSYKFNPLNAITITDAEGTVNLTTNIASTNIVYTSSSSAFAGTTTITVTYNDGRVLTMTLGKPSLNSPGSSKAITYANDGTIKSAAKVASKSATGGTWKVTSYSFKGTNGKTVTNSTVVTFTFPDKSCVTGDTLVMLADGSQKRIDEVTYSDELLVWDFFKGEYATVPSSIIFYHGDDNFEVLSLNFEDGTTVKTINVHGFFDVETNAFEFIETGNVESYIGHRFVKADGDSYKTIKLVSYDITEEYTGCYSIQTAMHNNFITEGMFSLTIPAYEGWFDYFEIGDNMKYDEVKMQKDIEKYGLYTYEDLADYVTYEQFLAFNGPYLKVLVGRGWITFEDILNLIATYIG